MLQPKFSQREIILLLYLIHRSTPMFPSYQTMPGKLSGPFHQNHFLDSSCEQSPASSSHQPIVCFHRCISKELAASSMQMNCNCRYVNSSYPVGLSAASHLTGD